MRIPNRLRGLAAGREALVVATIVVLAFAIRTVFGLPTAIENGFAPSGGSDSFYHLRIIEYVLENGRQLLRDPALNYPFGAGNPRPPMFQWSIAVAARMLQPFMDEEASLGYPFLLNTAFFGALTVIPIYLLARELAGRRAGYLAALFLALLPAHMTRSVATDADHDAMALFFIAWAIYFFYRALRETELPFKVGDYRSYLLGALRLEAPGDVYAALAGLSMASAANIWTGYFYAFHFVTISVLAYMVFSVIVRRHLHDLNRAIFLYALFFTIFSLPWYAVTGRLDQIWYAPQVILAFGVLAFGILMEFLWEKPWIVTLPGIGAAAGAAAFLIPTFRSYIHAVLKVYGKSKLYTTIAEAQPAPMGLILLYFGAGVFILALAGLVYYILRLRKEYGPDRVFVLTFLILSVWMTFAQARFVFNASPAIALLAGIFGDKLMGYFQAAVEEIRKARKGRWRLKDASMRALSVFTVAILILYPVVWFSVDAGIPYNNKSYYDRKVFETLPSFMRPNETRYNTTVRMGGGWYFGALGYRIPEPDDYWPRAWRWLASQDKGLPIEKKPAFLSWWDYGFECVQEGKHPTVADNFQNGYQFAGQVLMAQNESEVLALFIARQLEAIYFNNGQSLTPEAVSILSAYLDPVDVARVNLALSDPQSFKEEILNHPERYGGNYSEDISEVNLRYVAIKGILSPRGPTVLSDLLTELERYTGWRIRYIAVDTRLFPFSGRNPGIFYAPAKLSDHKVVEARGITVPIDFYDIRFVTESGLEYGIQDLPPNARVRQQRIEYKPAFYRSMLYRVFIGYAGQWVGLDEGVPGLSEGLYQQAPAQAWNLTHFKLVYRSVHDLENDTYIPIDLALKVKQRNDSAIRFLEPFNLPGINPLLSDTVIVRYYPGATVHGRVTMPDGTPVQGIMVTIYDEYNVPHGFAVTDSQGRYELTAVAGHLKLVFSSHYGFNGRLQRRPYVLGEVELNVTEAQAERVNQDLDGNGVPDYIIEKDFVIRPSTVTGVVYLDLNGNGRYDSGEEVLKGAKLILRSRESGVELELETGPLGAFVLHDAPPYSYNVTVVYKGNRYEDVASFELDQGRDVVEDVGIKPMTVSGSVRVSMTQRRIQVDAVVLEGPERYEIPVGRDGNYTASVLPGTYRIYVDDEEWKSLTYVRGSVAERNVNQSIEVRKRFEATIEVFGPRGARPSGIVVLTNLGDARFSASAKVTRGVAKLDLWEGAYSVYFEGEGLVASSLAVVRGDERLVLNAVDAVRVNVYTELSGSPVSSDVFVGGGDFLIFVRTGEDGLATLSLPEGLWTFTARKVMENETYFAVQDVYVSEGSTVYLSLTLTGEDKVSVLADGKPVSYACLLVVREGRYAMSSFVLSGSASVPEPLRNETLVVLSSHHREVEVSGDSVDLGPEVVEVRVKYPYTVPVELEFSAGNETYSLHLPAEDGILLPVGSYNVSVGGAPYGVRVSVGHPILKLEPGTVGVSFDPGISVEFGISFEIPEERASLTIYRDGDLYKSLTYKAGETVYLEEGNYTILGILVGERGFLTSLRLDSPRTLRPDISKLDSVKITFDEPNKARGMTISVARGEALIRRSVVSDVVYMRLPRGTYRVWGSRYDEGTGYVYSVSGLLDSSVGTVTLEVSETYVGKGITGTVTYGGEAVDAVVVFYDAKGNPYEAGVSGGSFEIELRRGTYQVYAYVAHPRPAAFLGSIRYEGGREWYNITLERAYVVHITTLIENGVVPSKLVIEGGGHRLHLNCTGRIDVVLPAGEYKVTADAEVVEYGMKVSYTGRENLRVYSETTLGIRLTRMNEYGLEATALVEGVQMRPGEEVELQVLVRNTGNLVEEVVLEPLQGPVSATPSVPVLELDPVGEGNRTTVLYRLVANETAAGNYHITLTLAVSGSNVRERVTVPVYVSGTPRYEIVLREDSMVVDNGTVRFSIEAKTYSNFTFTGRAMVYNADRLRSEGWEVSWINLTSPGEFTFSTAGGIMTAHVKGNFTAFFMLRPIVPNPERNVTLHVGLEDSDFGLVGDALLHLNITSLNLGFEAEGEEVHMEIPPINYIPMFTVFIVGMAIYTILLPRRRRK